MDECYSDLGMATVNQLMGLLCDEWEDHPSAVGDIRELLKRIDEPNSNQMILALCIRFAQVVEIAESHTIESKNVNKIIDELRKRITEYTDVQ